VAGEERSDAPEQALANPWGLEDSSPDTQTTHIHISIHIPDSFSEKL